MRCRSGNHEWLDQLDADRCCAPAWQRITILPGERIRDVLEDPRVARDGIIIQPVVDSGSRGYKLPTASRRS
jgi:hypothetical protein